VAPHHYRRGSQKPIALEKEISTLEEFVSAEREAAITSSFIASRTLSTFIQLNLVADSGEHERRSPSMFETQTPSLLSLPPLPLSIHIICFISHYAKLDGEEKSKG